MVQIPRNMRGSNSTMLQNAIEMAASSSKNAANSKGNRQDRKSKQKSQNRKK